MKTETELSSAVNMGHIEESPIRRGPGRPKTVRSDAGERFEELTDDPSVDRRADESDYGREEAEDRHFEYFRDSLVQSVLPKLPKIPGYHVCWLSTHHQADTIQNRVRMGYELIRKSEINMDFGASTHSTGEYGDVVAVKEMVAAKIPLRLYNKMMNFMHSVEPFRQEAGLREQVRDMQNQLGERGSRVDVGDGTAELGRGARPMQTLTE